MANVSYAILVLVHENDDNTISDMKAIDAYAIITPNETALELQDRLEFASYEKYGRSVEIYIKPYKAR